MERILGAGCDYAELPVKACDGIGTGAASVMVAPWVAYTKLWAASKSLGLEATLPIFALKRLYRRAETTVIKGLRKFWLSSSGR